MLVTIVLTLSLSITAFAGEQNAHLAYHDVLKTREGQILTQDEVFNASFIFYNPGL